MSAGSKIQDQEQEYQYSMPYVTPSGHEVSFYETPDNQRVVVKHTSGSHIEFKTDGSVFIKAVKDLHMHGSVLSEDQRSAGGLAKEADATTLRFDKDLTLEVGGTLHITARKLELDVAESSNMISGTETTITANNITEKAYENIALEGTHAIYVDTKDYRERSVTHRVEEGTMEDNGGRGGQSILNVHGNCVIKNDDPEGGITIKSRGYLNLVAGAERTDVVGRYVDRPSTEAVSTFTQKVYAPTTGSLNRSTMPGDYYMETEAGAAYSIASQTGGSSVSPTDGLQQEIFMGDMTQRVTTGNRERFVGEEENVLITGKQTIRASQIFLN